MWPQKSPDLHGNAPERCRVALLLVDVISDFAFPDGARLLPSAMRAARALQALKRRARRAGIPCIYANDNYGRWRSDFRSEVEHCLREGSRGAELVRLLHPEETDYFVLKPKHSAFYETCLRVLLEHLGVDTLVMGGFSTEQCVTFTAMDAYLRGYGLVIAADGTASVSRAVHAQSLRQLTRTLHARVAKGESIRFRRDRAGELRVRVNGQTV